MFGKARPLRAEPFRSKIVAEVLINHAGAFYSKATPIRLSLRQTT
jgi:hypothetical protein